MKNALRKLKIPFRILNLLEKRIRIQAMISEKEKTNNIIMFSILVLIIVGFYLRFSMVPSMDLSQHSDRIWIDIHEKNGVGDQWQVDVPEVAYFSPGKSVLDAFTYRVTVTNKSKRQLKSWKLRVNIQQECYLSNAYRGKVEIHQRDAFGKDVCQYPVSLWQTDTDDLLVSTFRNKKNILLIPLKPGDYIVYYPSESESLVEKMGNFHEYQSVNSHLVFYKNAADPYLDFSSGRFQYNFDNGVLDDPVFYIMIFLLIMWAVIYFYVIYINHIQRNNEKKSEKERQITVQTMKAFAKFIDAKDPYTGGHAERVGQYALLIAQKLGLSEDECHRIYYCGLLHDSGKLSIPDEILRKPGKLTDEEFTKIQEHTIKGKELLQDLTSMPEAGDVARYHHERFDGKGYPYGIKGYDIPLFARIVTVADSFDTMNSDRYYRKALPYEKIIEQLNVCSGTQFDPDLKDVMLGLIESGAIEIKNGKRE